MELPKIIAHRGGAGLAIENTTLAIQKSSDLGVKWIEVDLRLSKDGKIFIYHDDDFIRFNSSSFSSSSIEELTAIEISSLFLEHIDFPEDKSHILCLHHLLSLLKDLKISVNLELKTVTDNAEALVLALKKELQKWTVPLPPFYLSSFDEKALHFCLKYLPHIERSYLTVVPPKDWKEKIKELQAFSLALDSKENSIKMLKNYVHSKIPVLVYTVNDPEEVQNLISLGVTSVFTDCPNHMKRWL